MFEYEKSPDSPVTARGDQPIEFIYKGRRFRVHSILQSWRESGGWWQRLSRINPELNPEINPELHDCEKRLWRVEAAEIGALATFEIERDESNGSWVVRAASRPRMRDVGIGKS